MANLILKTDRQNVISSLKSHENVFTDFEVY